MAYLQTLNSAVWFSVMQGHVCNKTNQRHSTFSPHCKEISKENISIVNGEHDGKLDILLNKPAEQLNRLSCDRQKERKKNINSIAKIHANVR